MHKKQKIISVRDLKKVYRIGKNKVFALNGVSFDIYQGEFCAIVGTSGSGKSTLLNMLAGLEKPSRGDVFIRNQEISKMNEKNLVSFRRNHVGFIFQSFNLLGSLTASENIALPLIFRGCKKSVRQKKAIQMLKLVGLLKHRNHKPTEMSGGQQQRIGIARALVVDPAIIFADEPTGNLDSKTSAEIMSLIQSVSKNQKQTLVMVTHDDNLAQYADRIFRIIDGKIVAIEEGSKKLASHKIS